MCVIEFIICAFERNLFFYLISFNCLVKTIFFFGRSSPTSEFEAWVRI